MRASWFGLGMFAALALASCDTASRDEADHKSGNDDDSLFPGSDTRSSGFDTLCDAYCDACSGCDDRESDCAFLAMGFDTSAACSDKREKAYSCAEAFVTTCNRQVVIEAISTGCKDVLEKASDCAPTPFSCPEGKVNLYSTMMSSAQCQKYWARVQCVCNQTDNPAECLQNLTDSLCQDPAGSAISPEMFSQACEQALSESATCS